MSTLDNDIKKDLKKAQEYYKSKNYAESEEIYSKYYKTNPEEFSNWDKNYYVWAIYRHHLCESDDPDVLIENGELIKELTKQEDLSKKDKPCSYTLSIIKIIDYFSKNEEYEEVIFWCEQLDPTLLSTEQFISYNGNAFPSKKEKWYSEISKAYFKLEEYDECIKFSKEALEEIDDFANNNDVWFKYRLGKSLKEIGDYDEAIKFLEDALNIKNEWFFQREIAESYYFKQDFENALKYAISAALNNGTIESKINLYSFIQELLYKKGDKDAADKHGYLIYSIRLNKEYEIDDALEKNIKNCGFDLENDRFWTIEKELRDHWAELLYQDQELNYGTVEKIFPHGKSGFIMADNNKSYFFNMFDYLGDKNNINIGDYVSFYLKKGFDKKKNEQTLNAVYIKPGL